MKTFGYKVHYVYKFEYRILCNNCVEKIQMK